jgi:hypothetical protein
MPYISDYSHYQPKNRRVDWTGLLRLLVLCTVAWVLVGLALYGIYRVILEAIRFIQ